MKKWFLSSTGSGDLSLTIKGLLMSIIPVVVLVLNASGHDISIGEEQIDQFVIAVSGVISGVMFIIGLCRKIYFTIKNFPQSK